MYGSFFVVCNFDKIDDLFVIRLYVEGVHNLPFIFLFYMYFI